MGAHDAAHRGGKELTFHQAKSGLALTLLSLLAIASPAEAHKLRKQAEPVTVAGAIAVTPTHDWNSLDKTIGKNTETWTMDGERLNDITFFGGVAAGNPLVKEKSKKRDPLPKFSKETLPVEIPELLEGTYRTYKDSGSFQILSTEPGKFLARDGVHFTYTFTDEDELTRKGEARAAIIGGKLYMITFEAPRLGYFDKTVNMFRQLADTAQLK